MQFFSQVINNEVTPQERIEMYAEGGCYFITTRILIVDLLDQTLDPVRISGFLIYDAHRYQSQIYQQMS